MTSASIWSSGGRGDMVLTETGARSRAARRAHPGGSARPRGFRAPSRRGCCGHAEARRDPDARALCAAALLPALQERHPELRTRIARDPDRFLIEELARGALDVVMLALPAPIARHRDAAAVRRPVPAGGAGRRRSAEPRPRIDRRRYRSAPADPARGRALPARPGAGLLQRRRASARCADSARPSLTTVMQMVANGYGVTLVPKSRCRSKCATSA